MTIKRADPLNGLEMKFTALSSLTETGEVGRVKGYASRFGEADQSGDVVAPGAFSKSLKRLREAGRTIKFLWQHDPAGLAHRLDAQVDDLDRPLRAAAGGAAHQ